MPKREVPMQSVRQKESEGSVASVDASPFRVAFAEARRELPRPVHAADVDEANEERNGARFEARIEKRLGSPTKDVTRWNELGQHGWELVPARAKHAYFRRASR
jgi:hypothetical protein